MSERLHVINVGTAEQPNFGGSAEEMGRLRGIREALEAVRGRQALKGGENSYPEEIGRNDAYDDCEDAIVALLPKGVDW